MSRHIQLLNCPELKIHTPLLLALREMCGEVIKYMGFKVTEIINSSELLDEGIIICGNDVTPLSSNFIKNYLSTFKTAIFLGWFWKLSFPGEEYKCLNRFVHISGEKLNPYHDIDLYKFYNQIDNYIPITFLSDELEYNIGHLNRTNELDYCYMGYVYNRDLVPSQTFKGLYHATTDLNKYYTYNERKAIYLRSIFALGFHSTESIKQGSISQRIFEGLAYGCIVLTPSKYAEQYTDGSAIYVSDKLDLEYKMLYYKNNPQEIIKKQIQGYEWCIKYGTNRYLWNKILKKIETLFSVTFYRINFIICSYGGLYDSRHYDPNEHHKYKYLHYYIKLLNMIDHTKLTQVTIMKPSINKEHKVINDYYTFDIPDELKDKVKIIECPNKGISYGQFFTALNNDSFDYYIFTEDDYIPFRYDVIDILLSKYYYNEHKFLCLGINKLKEDVYIKHTYNSDTFIVPDFSIGIISNTSVKRIFNNYDIAQILNILDNNTNVKLALSKSQIIFGWILYKCGLSVNELNDYMSLFNCNKNPDKFLLTNLPINDRYIISSNIKAEYLYPLFVPIDLFFVNDKFLELIIKFTLDSDTQAFLDRYNLLNKAI